MVKTIKELEREHAELKKWLDSLDNNSPCDTAKYQRYKMITDLLEFERRLTEYDKQS